MAKQAAEVVCELAANIDDMTPEAISFAVEVLLNEGALDVYIIPVTMKKSRPAHLFTCLCRPEEAQKFAELILKHTTTFGVRKRVCERYTMAAEFDEVHTKYGNIKRKTGTGYGIKKSKPEYEDVSRAARENNVSLREVLEEFYAAQDMQKID